MKSVLKLSKTEMIRAIAEYVAANDPQIAAECDKRLVDFYVIFNSYVDKQGKSQIEAIVETE